MGNLKDIVFKYFDGNYKIEGSTVHLTHTYENDYAEVNEIEEMIGTAEVEFEDWVEERIGLVYQVKYACGAIEYYINHRFICDGVNPAIIYPDGSRAYYYKGKLFYNGIHHNELAIMMALEIHLVKEVAVDEYYRIFG
jgi:hypothetical protein